MAKTTTLIWNGGDVDQLIERRTGTPLMQVWFPGATRIFLPESTFSSDISYGVRIISCAIACINICAHVKDPVVNVSCSQWKCSMDYGNNNTPKMHRISHGRNRNGTVQLSGKKATTITTPIMIKGRILTSAYIHYHHAHISQMPTKALALISLIGMRSRQPTNLLIMDIQLLFLFVWLLVCFCLFDCLFVFCCFCFIFCFFCVVFCLFVLLLLLFCVFVCFFVWNYFLFSLRTTSCNQLSSGIDRSGLPAEGATVSASAVPHHGESGEIFRKKDADLIWTVEVRYNHHSWRGMPVIFPPTPGLEDGITKTKGINSTR